jgi:hypothetical protein
MSKKDKGSDTNIVLSRKQILQIHATVVHFLEVDQFEIQVRHDTGIGPTVCLRFALDLEGNKSTIKTDITDVGNW